MTGTIFEINISRGGIPKRSILSAALTPLGIEGDACAHPGIHGGLNQALLLIGLEVLEELQLLGFKVYPGALGENLTTVGLDYGQLRAGQRWFVGEQGLIELTKLRQPCRTLDVYNKEGPGRIQKGKIQKLLKIAGRGGWYARVLQGGLFLPGAPIRLADQIV